MFVCGEQEKVERQARTTRIPKNKGKGASHEDWHGRAVPRSHDLPGRDASTNITSLTNQYLTMNNPPTMEYRTQQLARLLASLHIVGTMGTTTTTGKRVEKWKGGVGSFLGV